MGDEKSDGVLAFARRWLPIWENEVRQFRSGLKRTSEIRDGRIVDTTDEDLQLAIRKVGEMQELIDRHEAIHAQGT